MKTRVVLSLLFLALSACGPYKEDMADDEQSQTSPDGLGTSPSKVTVTPCGIWTQHEGEDVEQASLVRDPDLIQNALPGGLACVDAIRIADVMWHGRSVVRYWP